MADYRQEHHQIGGKHDDNPGPRPQTARSTPSVSASRADRTALDLAATQHGCVTRRQLIEAGLSPRQVDSRCRRGLLVRIHRGVYRIGGPALSRDGRRLAAALAVGPGSALDGFSAAATHGISRRDPDPITVTSITHRARHRTGIRVRVADLPSDEVDHVRGIPVTSVVRTIFDLAASLTLRELTFMAAEADRQRLTSSVGLEEMLGRYPRKHGRARIEQLLAAGAPDPGTPASQLEERFAQLIQAAGLPAPLVNLDRRLASGRFIRIDFAWVGERVAVELDGRASHARKAQMRSDRERDRALAAEGWLTLRFVWEDLRAGSGARAIRDVRNVLEIRGLTPSRTTTRQKGDWGGG